jgi:hypothetical protein
MDRLLGWREDSSMSISKKRLAEIAAIPDEKIDTSDIPEVPPGFFQTARLILPENKGGREEAEPHGGGASTRSP